jgi:cyclin T
MTTSTKHFDISQLPSLKKDGMTVEAEALQRRKTCRFIEEAARLLKFHRIAISTAMVFFHRFYAKHSFSDHDRFEVAVAALVLAGKTEETPRKLNTVIDECFKLKARGMQAGRISTTGSGPASSSTTALDPKGEEFAKRKERILLLERVILHTIGFELSIDHPYTFLVDQIARLVMGKKVEYESPPTGLAGAQVLQRMKNEMTQYGMNFANDSMQTSLCLQFPPTKIAAAMAYLAAQYAKVQPSAGKDWSTLLEATIDVESLASISLQVLELMADRKGGNHKEMSEKIKLEIAQLKLNKASAGVSTPRPPPPGAPPAKRSRMS